MAGTDSSRPSASGGPAIILVKPQLGENIGTAARAMLNFGLTDLRLVSPRDGWPNPAAEATASRADQVLEEARVYETTEDAIAGLHHVLAVTARERDSLKEVVAPREAAASMRAWANAGQGVGLLFGPERAGLHNDDVALASVILTVPANPAFSSLNLAQAVLLTAYEWSQTATEGAEDDFPVPDTDFGAPATKDQLVRLFDHLEEELEAHRFFWPPERRTVMTQNLRNMLQRYNMTELDVRTVRGMIRALVGTKYLKPPQDPE
jgi:tRNA/rRNA methyltransferase